MPTGRDCPTCNGKGWFMTGEEIITCERCKGTGKIQDDPA